MGIDIPDIPSPASHPEHRLYDLLSTDDADRPLQAQALAKIERGHSTDLLDVRQMIERGLVEPSRLRELYSRIEDSLYKYPAIDANTFQDRPGRVS